MSSARDLEAGVQVKTKSYGAAVIQNVEREESGAVKKITVKLLDGTEGIKDIGYDDIKCYVMPANQEEDEDEKENQDVLLNLM